MSELCRLAFGFGVARVDGEFARRLVVYVVRTNWGACCPAHLEVN